MTLERRFNSFILAIVSILLLSLLLYSSQNNFIFINAHSSNNNKGNNDADADADLTTIKTNINLNNIDVENHDRLKIVGYLNGEGRTFYVDLKEHKDKTKIKDNNSLTVNLKFNKSNDISQVMFDDEYYVCGYLLDDDDKSNTNTNAITTKYNLPLYDCDEGNIGLTTIDKDSVKLFYTLKKFSESNALYKKTNNNNNNLSSTQETPKEVKLRINVPIHDNKKINDMYIVAMVKGEYQIKEIDVQNELEKGDKKSSNERLLIPFTFDRNTEVGLIEPGDMFFGCATSDEFPNQNSDCEKKVIKDLYKIDQLCARKDSSC
ncbi:MAG TPA: hypothetical protein VJ583_07370 [Nitrososphaeraceae archaeon]|nr:hypothetical protein [Nitrososphaeraceae archaeon]